MDQHYYSHGKLLLTGEYVVLDGALALAIPSKYGQHMEVSLRNDSKINWKSIDNNDEVWFEANMSISNNSISCLQSNNSEAADRLIQLFSAIETLNPGFYLNSKGFDVVTRLEFPNNWGLGTSSTLINNIASWTKVDPYKLLECSFGGSGYDIACAQSDGAITYKIENSSEVAPHLRRDIRSVDFDPKFKDQLYFVHLNKKQDSREGISHYRSHKKNISEVIAKIDLITRELLKSSTLEDFQRVIESHEEIIGDVTKQTPIKERLFSDFQGSMKSLGAWGGDFILVASETDPTSYFSDKGFSTVINYNSMIL